MTHEPISSVLTRAPSCSALTPVLSAGGRGAVEEVPAVAFLPGTRGPPPLPDPDRPETDPGKQKQRFICHMHPVSQFRLFLFFLKKTKKQRVRLCLVRCGEGRRQSGASWVFPTSSCSLSLPSAQFALRLEDISVIPYAWKCSSVSRGVSPVAHAGGNSGFGLFTWPTEHPRRHSFLKKRKKKSGLHLRNVFK